ncbi:MAG: ribonuclease HII [Gammaproteobacteria bacterium]
MTGSRTLIAGVDEAGRGPLAGPVYAAAVILNSRRPIRGLADSKLLKPEVREDLAALIQQSALAWAVACADVEEIEVHNILGATMLAMRRAVSALAIAPGHSLIDGNRCPPLACPASAVVGGDASVPAISAASILAKVTRDREMRVLDARHPDYGFAANKGYGTPLHLAALEKHGPSACHRRGFAPVRRVLEVYGHIQARIIIPAPEET